MQLTTPYHDTLPEQSADSGQNLKKAARASFIGNFVEWFDYGAYGYLAAVIATVFFPTGDKTTALMSAYAVFALSFLIRPLGGIFWGYIGDKYGRRPALSWSILIMSAATFLIALLPGYASIGIAAPIMLLVLRMFQGFSASGEYAGASAFLAEYAPPEKRGFYTSIVPASTAAGLLLGSLMAAGMYELLSTEAIADWGWRLPFLLAAPLGLVGRYIRLKLEETPQFQKFGHAAAPESVPISRLFRHHRRALLLAFLVACLNAVAFYLILSYMPTYLSEEMGVGKTESFFAASVSLLSYIGFIFLMGTLSDKYGRKTMLIAASVLFIVATVPLFSLFGWGGFGMILLIQIIFGAILSVNDGTLPAYLAELFPTDVRYTGFAFSFNCANALLGGTAPLVATWLISSSGSKLSPAWYLVAVALMALVAVCMGKDRSRQALS